MARGFMPPASLVQVYRPGPTRTTSPGPAAARAAPMVGRSPLPSAATRSTAPSLGTIASEGPRLEALPASSVARTARW